MIVSELEISPATPSDAAALPGFRKHVRQGRRNDGSLIDVAKQGSTIVGAARWEPAKAQRWRPRLKPFVDELSLLELWWPIRCYASLRCAVLRPSQRHCYAQLSAPPGAAAELLAAGIARIPDGEPCYLLTAEDLSIEVEAAGFLAAGEIALWPGTQLFRWWRPGTQARG